MFIHLALVLSSPVRGGHPLICLLHLCSIPCCPLSADIQIQINQGGLGLKGRGLYCRDILFTF